MKTRAFAGALAATLLTAGLFGPGASAGTENTLNERYRPQFHYTTIKGWINDPIGLLYYQGEYHLFNDHNPFSCRFPGGKTGGEQSHWCHAISKDLVHWKHMPIAVYPDANGACWSGSGVVDWRNTAGFRTGKEPPLVLVYTSAGRTFGQSLAYSNDRGRTWTRYKGNTVLGQIAGGNRDPQVFWHEPTKKWVMVLYVKKGSAHFFTSDDLKTWTPSSEVRLAGYHECPDLFELPVDGDRRNTRWVLYDARFMYWLGSFDGRTFKPEAGPLKGEHGGNFYAAQTWSCPPFRSTEPADARRVQIGWMRGSNFPKKGMPFNQQMSFPCELTLRTTDKGVRLFRYPIREIETLHDWTTISAGQTLPGENPLADVSEDLFDIDLEVEGMEVEPGGAEFGIRLHGQTIAYAGGKVSCLGRTAGVSPADGRIALRILVDRASIEVFANGGEVSLTSFFLPKEKDTGLELYAKGGDVRVRSLTVTRLKSAWAGR
jgi:sucrose-6-phosphate hydrolase SacC (GH32 family)